MNLFKLAKAFKKMAQITLSDTQRALQSISVIAGSSDKLYKDVQHYVNSKMMLPESLNKSNNLRKLASSLIPISNSQIIDWKVVESIANNLKRAVKEFEQNYMPEQWVKTNKYSPMIDLTNALENLLSYIVKVNKASDLAVTT